jgi:hypothetical protein
MTRDQEQYLADAIEKLIDAHGLDHFLSMSGFICGENAEKCATLWQDTTRAKHWMEISKCLDRLTAKAEEWQL